MDFQTNKIRHEIKESKKNYSKKSFSISASVIVSAVVIIFLSIGIVRTLKNIDFAIFLSIAGDSLQTDGDGHTNFLLLGNGGENHDGGDLTDSIIVASLDHKKKLITMLSIPRDFYVEDNIVGSSRINNVYVNANYYYDNPTQALEHAQKKVEEIIGEPIHYWAKVDFKGFKEMIDAIGGIDVVVDEAIYDPFYPKDGTDLYETFSLPAGPQHLDGATALKYARSRKTTSDFDRARRQQDIIFAMKEKALSSKILFNGEKIEKIMNTLKNNIQTNISTKEILTLGSMAGDFDSDKIIHKLIHDDPSRCGGFLYTPDRRLYQGAFVLTPAGGPEFLHSYIDLNFNHPEINHENAKIQVLNGTKTGGVAGETKQILQRYCFNVIRYGNGNSQDVQKTTYYYKQKYDEKGKAIDSRPLALDFLQTLIPGEESTDIPSYYQEYAAGADIIVELGYDYTNSNNYINDPFLALPSVEPYDDDDDEDAEKDSSETEGQESSPVTETTSEIPANETE